MKHICGHVCQFCGSTRTRPHVVVQWSSVFRFVQHVPTLWYRWIMRSPTGTKSASLFGNCVRDTFEPQLHKMRERKPTHQVVQSRRSTPCGRKVPMALGEPSAGFLESLSQELWVFVLLLVHHFCHVKKQFSVPIFRHTYLPICENMWKYVKICENKIPSFPTEVCCPCRRHLPVACRPAWLLRGRPGAPALSMKSFYMSSVVVVYLC